MQESRIEAYAVMQGLALTRTIREEGVSAGHLFQDRPGGAELLELVRSRGVRHIIALKLDRLFRDAADALTLIRSWDRAGISVHLVDMGGAAIDTASAMGRMMITMLAGFAEWERNVIAERTAAVLHHKKSLLEVYGPTPLGYRRDGKRLVANRSEMALVERIRHMVGFEGLAYREVARVLNAEGVPTKRGGQWFASTVSYLARNNLYGEPVE